MEPVRLPLSPHQEEALQSLEKAERFRGLVQVPGYRDLVELMDLRVKQAELQFLEAEGLDKDALWSMQIRVKGLRDFVQNLKDTIAQSIETLLDPNTKRAIVESVLYDKTDFEGELRPPDIADKE